MAKGPSGRRKLVPESSRALDVLKYEIAAELGLSVGSYAAAAQAKMSSDTEFAGELGTPANQESEPYWGDLSSRDAGAVGGSITARLIQKAEQSLTNLN